MNTVTKVSCNNQKTFAMLTAPYTGCKNIINDRLKIPPQLLLWCLWDTPGEKCLIDLQRKRYIDPHPIRHVNVIMKNYISQFISAKSGSGGKAHHLEKQQFVPESSNRRVALNALILCCLENTSQSKDVFIQRDKFLLECRRLASDHSHMTTTSRPHHLVLHA